MVGIYRSCFENRFYATAKALASGLPESSPYSKYEGLSGRSSYEALAARKAGFRNTIGISAL